MKIKLTALAAITTMMLPASAANQPLKLWYKAPAAEWTEALPLGNSRLGAMVYG
ncbi:MAG: glycoside hydrolase family 95 protein, partial [Duncaniella sp.]|nr:glycoside hydrolase family 95 protein [Duncaniella sp.]